MPSLQMSCCGTILLSRRGEPKTPRKRSSVDEALSLTMDGHPLTAYYRRLSFKPYLQSVAFSLGDSVMELGWVGEYVASLRHRSSSNFFERT